MRVVIEGRSAVVCLSFVILQKRNKLLAAKDQGIDDLWAMLVAYAQVVLCHVAYNKKESNGMMKKKT